MPLFTKPIRLAADNFTPLTRTPWAGNKICRDLKNFESGSEGIHVGESWEVSCDPTFPSMCIDHQKTLQKMINEYPAEMLGIQSSKTKEPTCEILLKIIDTSAPLSLQIHPTDNDPDLTDLECGKPESWYVLDNEPNAGIYLGFREKMTAAELKSALLSPNAKETLQFIKVKPGDYFEIAPGVPHAIGSGVTILEPQRILKGKTGKTFRMWDWGRRYNSDGAEDKNGTPRDLHVEQSVKLIDFEKAYGPKYIDSLRRLPHSQNLSSGVIVDEFPSNGYYKLSILKGRKESVHSLQHNGKFKLAFSLKPDFFLCGDLIPKGQALFIPASMPTSELMWIHDGQIAMLEPE